MEELQSSKGAGLGAHVNVGLKIDELQSTLDFSIILLRLAPTFSAPSIISMLGTISMYHQDKIPAIALAK